MARLFWIIARIVGYAMLGLVVAGSLSLILPFALDFCQNQSGGIITCSDPIYRDIFEFGFTVVMMSVFTGAPMLLALVGLAFVVTDIIKAMRKS